MKSFKLIISMTLAFGFAAAQAQTILKIGYATNKESHYGVGLFFVTKKRAP